MAERRKILSLRNKDTHPICRDCALDFRPVATRGPTDAPYLIVCKPPNDKLARAGEVLSFSAEKVLGRSLKKAGFRKQDFVFHNGVQCAFDTGLFKAKERSVIFNTCRQKLLNVVKRQQPKVIIPLGVDACRSVFNRPVKISKVRGVPTYSEELGCVVLPMLDPSFVSMYPQHQAVFDSDCQTLRRLVEADYDYAAAGKEVLGEYHIIDDLQFLIDRQPELLAFDVETLGLKWVRAESKILTMQFSTRPGEGYMLVWDHPERPMPMRQKQKIREQLRQLLLNPKTSVVGHNLKYDLLWIWSHLGFRFRVDHDTLMLVALLDENSQSKDLDTVVKMYAPQMGGYADAFNQKYDKSRMDLVPLADLVDYGCGDVDAVQQVFPALTDILRKDSKLWNHYRRVSIPGINAFAAMERIGMLTDNEAIEELEEELSAYLKELTTKLMKQVPVSIKKLHMEKGLSFTRKDFLVDILFRHQDGFKLTPRVFTEATERLPDEMKVPSTSAKDHLPYFFEDCEFTIELADWVQTERLLNTSIRRFRQKYIYRDRVYPSYSLWTAVTGRSASSDPNGQNFPKRGRFAKAYRKIFVPPQGYVMLEADLSQAELRIAGSMAMDRHMIRIYQQGGDIHAVTACIVLGVSREQFDQLPKEERSLARFKAKAVNFGFLYGMGWRNFIVYAKTQYGVEFTEREARRIREAFFDTYTGLEPWHVAVREFVREHSYVRSYSGRVRHLPMIKSQEEGVRQEAERQAINSPVQEFGSTLGVMAMARIDQEINPDYFALYGFVHDALYAYVPLQYVEWGAKTMKHYMESNPLKEWFGIELPIPITADVGFGFNGKDINEMPGLELDKPYDFSCYEGLVLPEQVVPPNNGRIITPEYLKIAA